MDRISDVSRHGKTNILIELENDSEELNLKKGDNIWLGILDKVNLDDFKTGYKIDYELPDSYVVRDSSPQIISVDITKLEVKE